MGSVSVRERERAREKGRGIEREKNYLPMLMCECVWIAFNVSYRPILPLITQSNYLLLWSAGKLHDYSSTCLYSGLRKRNRYTQCGSTVSLRVWVAWPEARAKYQRSKLFLKYVENTITGVRLSIKRRGNLKISIWNMCNSCDVSFKWNYLNCIRVGMFSSY